MKQSTRLAATRRSLAVITILACAGLASACTNDETAETVRLRGQLTYPQNTPLPDDASARVSLIERAEPQPQNGAQQAAPEAQPTGKRIVAEQTLHNLKQQPVGFDLQVGEALLEETGRYVLRAQINNGDGQAQWHTTEPMPIEPSQADREIELVLAPTPENIAVLSFTRATCEDGFAFAVAAQPGRAVLRLGDRVLMLPSVESASGAKYADDQNIYWNKGNQALAQIDGQQHSNCTPEKPKQTAAPDAAEDILNEAPEEASQNRGRSTQE